MVTLNLKLTGRERIEAEGLFKIKTRTTPSTCCVSRCSGDAGNTKKRVGDCWFCGKHWTQRWRLGSPKQAGFFTLMTHARERGIAFTIPFTYYLGLMDAAAAWDLEAEKRGDIVTIDRIKASRGYEIGNVRAISLSENVVKGNRERYLPENVQSILARKRAKLKSAVAWYMQEPDMPF